jgi:hypothetical protein
MVSESSTWLSVDERDSGPARIGLVLSVDLTSELVTITWSDAEVVTEHYSYVECFHVSLQL